MAKSRELLITLGADTTRFSQKVKRAKDLTKELDAQFGLLSSSSNKFENSLEGLAKKSDYYGNKIKIANELSKAHIARLKETQEELDRANEEYERCSKKVEELNEQIKQAKENKTPYADLEKQLEGATQELTKATKEVRTFNNRMIDSKKGYAEVQTEMQNYQREIVETIQKMELMDQNDGFDNMKNDIKETNRTFELLSTSTKNFGNTMETLELSQNHYADMVSRTTNLQKEYRVAMENSSATIAEQKTKVAELQKEMERYEKMRDLYDPSDDRFGFNAEKVSELRLELTKANAIIEVHEKNIESLGQEYKSTDKEIANFTNKLNNSTEKIKKMVDSITFEKLDSEIEKMAKDTLARLKREIDDIDHGFEQLEKSCSNFSKTTTGLEKKQDHLVGKIRLTKQAFNEYTSSLVESKKKTDELIARKQHLEKVMQSSVDSKNSLTGKQFDDMNESLEKAKKEYELVNKELKEWTSTMKASENGVKSTKTSLTTMNKELRETKTSLKEIETKKAFDELEDEIDDVNNKFKILDAQINLTKSKFANYENSLTSVISKKKMLAQQITLTRTQITNYNNSIEKNKQHIEKLITKHSELKTKIDSTKKSLNDKNISVDEYERLTQELISLEDQYDNVNDKIKEHKKTLADLQAEQINARASVNDLARELNTTFGDAMIQAGQSVQNFGQGVQSIGQAMLPMTMALGGLGAMAIKTGMDFTSSMSEVGAITGATGEELDKLTDSAREWGAKTVYSATDASQALKYLGLAGYDTNQAIGALPLVLQTAQAGAMDLAMASDLATDSISSLGYVGDDAVKKLPEYLNMVAGTAMNANTSVEQLMRSYIKVGGQVDNMNISLETSSTMLGVLANRGIKAEEAGNSLNSILINMTKTTGESAKGMKALGVSVFDAKGNIRDIEDVMVDMSKALAKLGSDEERVNIINMIGGKTQAKTLQKLLQGMVTDTGQLTEEYKSLKSEIESAVDTDSLEQMSKAMTDNLSGDWANLESVIEESFLSIFDSVEPVLRQITQNVTSFIESMTNKFNSLGTGTQHLVIKFGLLAMAIPPVTIALGAMIKLFGTFMKVTGTVSKGFGLLKTAFTAFTGTSGALISKLSGVKSALINTVGSTSTLGKAFGLLTGKTALLAGGVGVALSALIAFWVKGQEKSVIGAKNISKNLDKTSQSMVDSFVDASQKVDSTFIKLKSSVNGITSKMITEVNSNIAELANQGIDLLEKSADSAQKIIQKNFDAMGTVDSKSQQILLTGVQKAYDTKVKIIEDSQKAITDIMTKAKEENRNLNAQELMTIQEHQNKIRESTLSAMSQYTSEIETIRQKLVDNEKSLNAESVADAIKNAKEKKDGTIEQANKQVNELTGIMDLLGSELGVKETRILQQAIDSATERRNETVRIAEEEYANLIEVARKTARDQVDTIDWATGEVKTKWEMFWDGLGSGTTSFLAKLASSTYSINTHMEVLGKYAEIAWLKLQKLWSGDKKDAQIDKNVEKLQKEITTLQELGSNIDQTIGRYKGLSSDLASIGEGINQITFDGLGVNLAEFANNVNGSLDKVTNDFDSLPFEVQNALREYDEKLVQAGVSGGMKQFIQYLQGDLEYVRMEFNDMSSSAQESLDALSSTFKDHADLINDISFEDFVIMTQTDVTRASEIWNLLPQSVRTSIEKMPKEDWEQILTYYVNSTNTKMSEVGTTIDQKGTENAQKQYEQGKKGAESHAKGIEDGKANVVTAIDNVNQTATNKLGETAKDSTKKGNEITSGVATGMNQNIGAVEQSVGKIQGALNNIDSIKLGGVTKQLSEVEKWLDKVTKASATTKKNLTALQTVSYGGVTKGLSEVNKHLKDNIAKSATTVKTKLQEITKVTYGGVTKGLSEINKWLKDRIAPSAVTAHGKLLTLSRFTFSGVISGLRSINSWLNTIQRSSSSAKSALLAVANASKASIDPNKPLGNPIPDFGMDAYNRNIETMTRDINMANFKTSGGFYEPTSMTKTVSKVTSEQDKNLTNLLKATLEQNQLLLGLLGQEKQIVTYVTVDGKQIAKASAPYMNSELNTIKTRKNRLGGKI